MSANHNKQGGIPTVPNEERRRMRVAEKHPSATMGALKRKPMSFMGDGGDKQRAKARMEDVEYVIDRVVTHGVNKDGKHPNPEVGETVFRVLWYGYGSKDDTFEPIHHLPRSKILSYCNRRKLPIPIDIGRAMIG